MSVAPPNRLPSAPAACSVVLFVLALCIGCALRLPDLGARPMHTDEAVHGIKLGELLESGTFVYDPVEYHGPTLAFSTAALAKLTGKTGISDFGDGFLRLVPALYGIALIAMLPLFQLGRWPTVWAALFTAVSPMLTYYSRYFIMEVLFAFFLAVAIGAGWRCWQTRKSGWAIAAGASIGLAHATKETVVIHLGAAGFTLAVLYICSDRPKLPWKHLLLGGAAAAVTSAVLFSSFGTHPSGIWDSIDTYRYYLTRSGGEGHEQPFWHYAQLLTWSTRNGITFTEAAVVLLAIAGAVTGKTGIVRFLALYTLASFLVYSALSYKTPWTILATYHGAVILAGCGAAWVVGIVRHPAAKAGAATVLAVAAWHLAAQTALANGRLAADPRNPWVYSHTTTNYQKLVRRLDDLSPFARSPLVIQVVHPEFGWPLPWTLRDHPTIGFQDSLPKNAAAADVLIVDADLLPLLEESHYADGPYGLRPGVFVYALVRNELWDAFLATR